VIVAGLQKDKKKKEKKTDKLLAGDDTSSAPREITFVSRAFVSLAEISM